MVNQKTKAHIALIATNLFFAVNFTAVKFLINNGFINAFGLNLVRVFVTAVLFWILYFFKTNHTKIVKKDVGRFLLCALTGIAINQLFFIKGLSLTYSIHASLLLLITPILITIIASFLLKEKITSYKIIGLFLGILGALILILSKDTAGNAANAVLGDVFVILNAISYTFYFVLVKPLMKIYNPIMILRVIFTIGFFMILPVCYNEFKIIPWQQYDVKAFATLALIAVAGTFFAYLFNIYGIKILGASIAGAYIYSQPLFAAIIAVSFLNEQISANKIIAAICIFAGVFISNKQKVSV